VPGSTARRMRRSVTSLLRVRCRSGNRANVTFFAAVQTPRTCSTFTNP
jgi:hypothetical protein